MKWKRLDYQVREELMEWEKHFYDVDVRDLPADGIRHCCYYRIEFPPIPHYPTVVWLSVDCYDLERNPQDWFWTVGEDNPQYGENYIAEGRVSVRSARTAKRQALRALYEWLPFNLNPDYEWLAADTNGGESLTIGDRRFLIHRIPNTVPGNEILFSRKRRAPRWSWNYSKIDPEGLLGPECLHWSGPLYSRKLAIRNMGRWMVETYLMGETDDRS